MTCSRITIGGVTAIVCEPRGRRKRCACGRPADRLCDWKTGAGKTCDKPLCDVHAERVAPEKDLCPEHQEAYRDWLAARQQGASYGR